jgi:hypothetical protein
VPSFCTWVGDQCGVNSCVGVGANTICVVDGGLGRCFGQVCHVGLNLQTDPNNCGAYGVFCPPGIPCQDGQCTDLACGNGVDSGCPKGSTCDWYTVGFTTLRGCSQDDCTDAGDDQACTNGFCCAGSCHSVYFSDDPDNCGGCGIRCPDGGACQYNRCVTASCSSSEDETPCALDGGVGTCCGRNCVDVYTDPQNCGVCGQICGCDGGCPDGSACFAYDVCVPVVCGADSDGDYCLIDADAGTTGVCCSGSCTSYYDSQNCGTCGRACAPGDSCIGGSCATLRACNATGDYCLVDGGTPGTCCGSVCVDISSDPRNCGFCDLSCPAGSSCSYYACYDGGMVANCLGDTDCPPGDVCATAIDLLNRGGLCVPPECDGGNELCRVALDDVIGLCCGNTCVEFSSDPNNCGGCGYTCPSGLACNGNCSDPDSGVFALGPDHPCPAGFLSEGVCVPPGCDGQKDGYGCSLGSGLPGACCGGTCVDTTSDPQNCYGCGIACAAGYCQTGWGCVPGSIPQGCLQSCGPGTMCAGGACVNQTCLASGVIFYQPTLASSEYCLAQDGDAGLCCPSGACAHFDSDPLNCGGCGVICAPGQSCQNGLCNGDAQCGAGHAGAYCRLDAGLSFLCCPGLGCTDTSFDSQNCGSCNVACPASETCDAGVCN